MEYFKIIDSVLDEKKTYISLKWDTVQTQSAKIRDNGVTKIPKQLMIFPLDDLTVQWVNSKKKSLSLSLSLSRTRKHTHSHTDSSEWVISLLQRQLATQQTTNTRHKHSCPLWNLKPWSQESSAHSPMP